MDEVQIIAGSPLDTIISAIGRYMQQPTCGYIYILLTGTYYTGIRNSLLGSGYAPRYIPIRAMLPITQLSQIIDSLNTEHEKLNGWRKNAAFRHYLRTFSGYARGIEYYLSYYVSSKRNCTPKDARDAARNDIIGKYDFGNVLSLEIKNAIVQCVITRKVVFKGEQIGGETWSDLEDKGLVMLEQNTVKVGQTSSNTEYIITYPPIIFPELMPYNLKETYDKVFNADTNALYGSSWEDVVWNYYYLILNLLQKKELLKMKELFPFAKMNSNTANLEIKKIYPTSYQCTLDKRLNGDMSERNYLNLQSGSTTFTFPTIEKKVKNVYVVKNGYGDGAGDILLLGMIASNGNNYVVHMQCKWADSNEQAELDYSGHGKTVITEMEKNTTFMLPNNTPTTNITVILTGKSINNLPDQLPDNLIVICKDNFADHFGILADHMKYLNTTNYLHINECSVDGLVTLGIEVVFAKKIIEIRDLDPEGFKDIQDLQTKLEDELFKTLKSVNIIF